MISPSPWRNESVEAELEGTERRCCGGIIFWVFPFSGVDGQLVDRKLGIWKQGQAQYLVTEG